MPERPNPDRGRNSSRRPAHRSAAESGSQKKRQDAKRQNTPDGSDYTGLKFLAVMFIALLLVFSGVYAVKRLGKGPGNDNSTDTYSEPATVNVTFPEGRTIRQYGALLEQNEVCTAEDFYSEMRTTDFTADYYFLPSNDILQQREYPLEGYLYPDTYTFYVGENPKSVIKRFLNNFKVKLTEEAVQYANSNGEEFKNVKMSFDQAVILASIIERESPDGNERPKIAAVFWNRMERPVESGTGGKLQSDATHYYPYVVSDERPEGFRSEYDTYNIVGLPKGPICNPSVSSIMAAIYPDKDCKAYYFFNDKMGNHYYADTYAEHKKNIKYCKDNGLA